MKILVIGATGFIGKYYCNFSKFKNRILKTSSKKRKKYIFLNFLKNSHEIDNIISKNSVEKIVFLSAISDPSKCYLNKKNSNEINITKTKKILKYLIKKKKYFIFFSSEYVFDGSIGNYTEKSKAKPILLYGKQKLQIENFLNKTNYRNYAIFRISKTFGCKKNDGSIFSNFLKDVKKYKKINVSYDQIFCPLYIMDLVKIIDIFIKKNIRGTFNVCGDRKISRYNLIKLFCNYFKITNELIKKKLEYFVKNEIYPLNTSMKNNKIKKKIKFNFSSFKDIFPKFYERKN